MNSIQAIAKRVEELDLRPIKVKLMDPHSGEGWTEEYTDKVEIWYRRFLALSLEYPQKLLVVNDAVDTFWHYHILDTRKYADDCQQVFGHFLHHFPYFGMRGEEDARNLQKSFDDTMDLMKQEFLESLEDAFGSRWESQNRPTRTEQPRFKGASCSDCTAGPSQAAAEDGAHIFLRERPTEPVRTA